MNDLTLDPRALGFLAEGPTRAPADAFDAIVERVAAAPQDRPFLRLRGRPIRIHRLERVSRRPGETTDLTSCRSGWRCKGRTVMSDFDGATPPSCVDT